MNSDCKNIFNKNFKFLPVGFTNRFYKKSDHEKMNTNKSIERKSSNNNYNL